MKNKVKGFTLVELLVVIAILAILATVSIVGYTQFINKSYVSNDLALVKQMNNIIYQMKLDEKEIDIDSIEVYAQKENVSIATYKSKTDDSVIVFDDENDVLVQCKYSNNALVALNDDVLPTDKTNITVVIHTEDELNKYSQYNPYIAADYSGTNIIADDGTLPDGKSIVVLTKDISIDKTINVSSDITIYGCGYTITQNSGDETFKVSAKLTLNNLNITNMQDHCFDNNGQIIINKGTYKSLKNVFNNDESTTVTIYNGTFESNYDKKDKQSDIWYIRNNKGSMIIYNGTFKVFNAPYNNNGIYSFFWSNSGLNPTSIKPTDKEVSITFSGDTATVQ